MIWYTDKPTAFFDVDETLVMWSFSEHDLEKTITIGCDNFTQIVLPHERHIQELKNHKARNHVVIVWSAGGSEWAKSVVTALGLEEYVDIVLSKPNWFYDDLKPEDFMTNRIYHKM